MKVVKVGTRSSQLAVIQTQQVVEQLRKKRPEITFELILFETAGDQRLDVPLAQLASGIFLNELEEALINEQIDFAVHSLKDMPIEGPRELCIAAFPQRENPADALLTRTNQCLSELPAGAVIGTSSMRRSAQVKQLRPDLQTEIIRGPIDRRIQQLKEGKYDGIILAMAGLNRLGIGLDLVSEELPITNFTPAMGQGALAIQCRREDKAILEIVQEIHDKDTERAVAVERGFQAKFAEGDRLPLAALATSQGGNIQATASLLSLDGQVTYQATASGQSEEHVSQALADQLTAQPGVIALLKQLEQQQ